MLRRTAWLVTLLLAIGVCAAHACPNCTASMPGTKNPDATAGAAAQPPKAGLADGFYYSILLMLAIPYTLAGVGGYALYRTIKRRSLAQPTPLTPARS